MFKKDELLKIEEQIKELESKRKAILDDAKKAEEEKKRLSWLRKKNVKRKYRTLMKRF